MARTFTLLFGVVGYAVFFTTFLYLIGFVSGFVTPTSLDAAVDGPSFLVAAAINLGLIALFGVQHWVMARPGFKAKLTRFVPKSIERTIFMLATCTALGLIFTFWQPMPTVLWQLEGAARWTLLGIAALGWTTVLLSTFLIDHFDLFGLRQTWFAFRGRPYFQKPFVERSFYRYVRHPLMLGFMIAFWSSPTMTQSHLLFAIGFTSYILAALFVEERDLVALHGNAYRDYQRRVPKLLPLPKLGQARRSGTASHAG